VAELVEGPIVVEPLLAAAARPDCGAVLLFLGTTRDRHAGRRVVGLFYEAYRPMALAALERIERHAVGLYEVAICRIVHRLGEVPPGQASVAVVVAAAHRVAAFDACRWVMDELKTSAPIWKKESYDDGSAAWIEGAKL